MDPLSSMVSCKHRGSGSVKMSILCAITDPQGNPALSIFLWEDGAQWDWLMNHYMNDPFPQPPDPSIVHGLFNNGSLVETFRKAMSARLEEIDA